VMSLNSISSINNSTWKVYDIKKVYESDNYAEAYAIDLLLKNEVVGMKVIIKDGYIQLEKEHVIDKVKIIEITENVIIGEQNGERGTIKYKLLEKGEKCDFTFQDGSVLYTKRIE
jgi:hypothetical protein